MKNLKKTQRLKEEASEIFKAGNYEEAIAKFEETVQIDPLNAVFNGILQGLGTFIAMHHVEVCNDSDDMHRGLGISSTTYELMGWKLQH